ncbi:MAG TPA: ferrous iron transport protein A [Chloroflexi bacterium]|nr:ferrous iron transport protein A [Chloroflexota bacterium]
MVPLVELTPGQTGVVRNLYGGRRLIGRLAALGFTPGAPITVVRNHGMGPIIVSLRGTQVALGRGEARRVMVRLAEQPHDDLSCA